MDEAQIGQVFWMLWHLLPLPGFPKGLLVLATHFHASLTCHGESQGVRGWGRPMEATPEHGRG